MTGLDLIQASLRLIGALASGESASAAESTDGLATLNRLLGSWSTESLLIPAKTREVFSLTAGKQTYTMGTGGDFNTSRPIRIENAELQIAGASPLLELPIRILNEDEYARIPLKTLQADYPSALYSDGASPATNINLYPVPGLANSLVIYSSKPLASLTLSASVSLPPGAERALVFNLAVDLSPEYGKALREDLIAIAASSKAALKRANIRPRYLKFDGALSSRSRNGVGSGSDIILGGGSPVNDGLVDGGTF